MYKSRAILAAFCLSLAFGEYDYSLEDINPSSAFYGQNVGTGYFEGKVTMHYFGHYN